MQKKRESGERKWRVFLVIYSFLKDEENKILWTGIYPFEVLFITPLIQNLVQRAFAIYE